MTNFMNHCKFWTHRNDVLVTRGKPLAIFFTHIVLILLQSTEFWLRGVYIETIILALLIGIIFQINAFSYFFTTTYVEIQLFSSSHSRNSSEYPQQKFLYRNEEQEATGPELAHLCKTVIVYVLNQPNNTKSRLFFCYPHAFQRKSGDIVLPLVRPHVRL